MQDQPLQAAPSYDQLIQAEPQAWQSAWDHYAPAAYAAVAAIGGTEADARLWLQSAFFQTFQALRQASAENAPSMHAWRTDHLALLHGQYRRSEAEALSYTVEQPLPYPLNLADDVKQALRQAQDACDTMRLWTRMPDDTRTLLRQGAALQRYRPPGTPLSYPEDCAAAVRAFLQNRALHRPANEPIPSEIPDEEADLMLDHAAQTFWMLLQALPQGGAGASDRVADKKRLRRRRTWLTLTVLAILSALGYLWYQNQRAQKLYNRVFQPPQSLVADWEMRYKRSLADTLSAPLDPACAELLYEADEAYQNNNPYSALAALGRAYGYMTEDEEAPCRSSVLYYMGLTALQVEKPDIAIECFAKIEDAENFGQDLYWYQAMALLQAARQTPALRERAARALERAAANADTPERREAIEQMARDLQ